MKKRIVLLYSGTKAKKRTWVDWSGFEKTRFLLLFLWHRFITF